jgi:D-alanine-D-alanine ligase
VAQRDLIPSKIDGQITKRSHEIMIVFQSTISHRKPPGNFSPPAPWRIALLANLKDEMSHEGGEPPDAGAEFDRRETIEAIAQALERDGHWVHFCSADQSLVESLTNLRPHFCFNIAEGIQGDAREAQAPALCELLGIPYSASRVLPNAISLDKTQTKRIWMSHGLPTPKFQEFKHSRSAVRNDFVYPLLVKPAREGTGMGIDEGSIVFHEKDLRKRIDWVVKTYHQPALVEEFLPGREFTVGFIGNPGKRSNRRRPELYDSDGYHFFPVLELDSARSVSPSVYGNAAKSLDIGEIGAPEYICPAPIPRALVRRMKELTRQAAEAIGAADVSRVDFRLGSDGEPYLLEINTLPGLNPAVSDLCIMAAAEGMQYDVLIQEILYLAAERFSLPFDTIAGEGVFSLPLPVRESMERVAAIVPQTVSTVRSMRRSKRSPRAGGLTG